MGRVIVHRAAATVTPRPQKAAVPPDRRMRSASGKSLATAAVMLLLGWGALAFGAVYPWGMWPLFAGSALTALLLWRRRAPSPHARVPSAVAMALAAVTVAIAIQLVPMSADVRAAISPEADAFLRRYELGYVIHPAWHQLSLDPAGTRRALAGTIAFGLLLIAIASRIRSREAIAIAGGVLVLGIVMAVGGIVQRAVAPGTIYGFWIPYGGGSVIFGPFVNRNHFAGWMLMAMPLSLGYVASTVSDALPSRGHTVARLVSWFGSPAGCRVLIAIFAVFVMALAVLVAGSRSALASLALTLPIAVVVLRRRLPSWPARLLLLTIATIVVVLLMRTSGAEELRARLDAADGGGLSGRVGAWTDTVAIAKRYPLAGAGVNTFGSAMLVYQEHRRDKYYSAAHNDYLQLLAEGGLLLLVPVLVLIVCFVVTVRRRFREERRTTNWIRVGATTGVAAIALQECVDFSLQIPGNAVMFAVLAGLALHRSSLSSAAERQIP